ncbi:DUF6130 family protein [Mesorhizobium sp. M0676]|uniref:DUF6130 family protein n=1 Tax=unclassified Mesorhizobium TaxID=325217 RepID=UPI0033359330
MKIYRALIIVCCGAFASGNATAHQTAKQFRGGSPYVPINSEPPPKLIVDPPLPEGLKLGVFWAQYRVENLRIVPVFGAAAKDVSPRVGHLHVIVDDLPWWWADASDTNTVDIANFPPGPHKVRIQLVDPDHTVFPGQEKTINFVIPETGPAGHSHPATLTGYPSVGGEGE